jgi:hypothetical protein
VRTTTGRKSISPAFCFAADPTLILTSPSPAPLVHLPPSHQAHLHFWGHEPGLQLFPRAFWQSLFLFILYRRLQQYPPALVKQNFDPSRNPRFFAPTIHHKIPGLAALSRPAGAWEVACRSKTPCWSRSQENNPRIPFVSRFPRYCPAHNGTVRCLPSSSITQPFCRTSSNSHHDLPKIGLLRLRRLARSLGHSGSILNLQSALAACLSITRRYLDLLVPRWTSHNMGSRTRGSPL